MKIHHFILEMIYDFRRTKNIQLFFCTGYKSRDSVKYVISLFIEREHFNRCIYSCQWLWFWIHLSWQVYCSLNISGLLKGRHSTLTIVYISINYLHIFIFIWGENQGLVLSPRWYSGYSDIFYRNQQAI